MAAENTQITGADEASTEDDRRQVSSDLQQVADQASSPEQAPQQQKGRPRGRPFQPGESGNPGGRPRGGAEVRELAKKQTRPAIEALINAMKTAKSPRDRVAAATALLDRAWGRPSQEMGITVSDGDDGGGCVILPQEHDPGCTCTCSSTIPSEY